MKQLTIISGKGGTGKTTIASNFIKLARNHIAVDCDVDASNLNILLNPEEKKEYKFTGGGIANLTGKCIDCKKCEESCRFEAIKNLNYDIKVDPLKCEGCGVCVYVCPVNALELEKEVKGCYYISDSPYCKIIHARLNPGSENSGLLVSTIRNLAEDIAYSDNREVIIIDGAAGIGCPVISSLNGIDYALVVTEPTLSGISDFIKICEVTKFFNIKTFTSINKYDLNIENSKKIEELCAKRNTLIAAKIPYDNKVSRCLSIKKFIVDDPESPAGIQINNLWSYMSKYLYSK